MSFELNTFIWTIISFFLLCVLLKKLFFDPVLKNIDARNKKIADRLDEEKDAKVKLESAQDRIDEEYRTAVDEAQLSIRESKQKDMAAYDAEIAEAHEESSKIIQKANEEIINEEDNLTKKMDEQIPELVCSLAGRLLGEPVDVAENKDLINAHLTQS